MAQNDRRQTERAMLEIPIRVIYFGSGHSSFSEDTRTIEVNRAGGRIVLRNRVAPDDTLRIINLENLAEADFRVVGMTRSQSSEGSEWGVECSDPGRNIWGVEFPAPLAGGDSKAGAVLECQGCHKQVLCILSLVDVAMLDSAGSLDRLCQQCGELTPWVYSDIERRPKAPAERALPTAPPPTAKWDGKSERRLHRRLPLKLPVLISDSRGQKETAKTENVSKGGLAVVLGLLLNVGELVTVVCPYTAGGQNFEQKAEIRRRVVFYEGSRWLYGLRLVR
jgi:hypothetical protein